MTSAWMPTGDPQKVNRVGWRDICELGKNFRPQLSLSAAKRSLGGNRPHLQDPFNSKHLVLKPSRLPDRSRDLISSHVHRMTAS